MTKTVESVDNIIENRRKEKKQKKRQRMVRVIRSVLIHSLLAVLIGTFIEFKWDAFKTLEIRGNYLLTEEEIRTELNLSDRSFLNFGPLNTLNLERHPLIKSLDLDARSLNHWVLTLEEMRPLASINASALLLENGSTYPSSNRLDLPLVEGYGAQDYAYLTETLASIDQSTLVMISSITKSPKSFDERYAHLYMQDGIQVDTSLKTLVVLNDYYAILSVLNPEHRCIAIDEVKSVPYSFPCTPSSQ